MSRVRYLTLTCSALTGLIAASSCDQFLTPSAISPPPVVAEPAGPAQVPTILVNNEDLAQEIRLPGTIEGYETAALYAKVGGYLQEISVHLGDRVRKGQPLARLYIPEAQKELEQKEALVLRAEAHVEQAVAGIRQARAEEASALALIEEAKTLVKERESQLKFRDTEFQTVRILVQSGSMLAKRLNEARYQVDAAQAALQSVTARGRSAEARLEAVRADIDRAEKDLASAQAEVRVARASVEHTLTMMAYATILAPFDGVVIKRTVDTGAFILPADGNSAAQPLLTVTRTDIVRVAIDLPMKEVRWLDLQDRAVLSEIAVLPDEEFAGSVARFSPSLDLASRMMRVEIDLPNADGRLLPGYYGSVRLRLSELPQTPVVPSSALLSDGTGTFVLPLMKVSVAAST